MIAGEVVAVGLFYKALEVVLLSTVKFLVAPLVAKHYGFNFLQIFFTVSIGGVLSVIVFYLISEWALKAYDVLKKKLMRLFGIEQRKKDPKKVFTKKNRMIVKLIRTYGLVGLVVLTPVLNIPLGTFLTTRYFHHREHVLLYLSLSVMAWSFVLSAFFSFVIK